MRITENSEVSRAGTVCVHSKAIYVEPVPTEGSKAGFDYQMKDLKPGPSYSLVLVHSRKHFGDGCI